MLKPQVAKVITHMLVATSSVPNNKRWPLLIYQGVFSTSNDEESIASSFEHLYSQNKWRADWRYTVYPFQHFHTTSPEVLGCFKGHATVLFGGDTGVKCEISAGDMVIIPPGVGHKCLSEHDGFTCVGGYPEKLECDMNKEGHDNSNNIPNIDNVPLPTHDPVYGKDDGYLTSLWK